ncbi:ATP-dependent nuclease [Taibaiella koreensis]|uniref:ATP-dependent nuclease n=1 Tax=Taibaiella koreensis TaxID=1268548 RepID=UPI000E5A093F|nr:AAA family ATPase [Taibaiella koreensis]
MIIKQITIKYFRSIGNITIDLNDLSLFVGKNDAGKSNVLKALNLFFNNETDYGKPFDFDQDYCIYAPQRNKKAPEIFIDLIITPPKTYKGSKDIKWSKSWRKNGLQPDNVTFANGTRFPRKSKLFSWLSNIRYAYVPAIRGNTYFQILLAQLHDSLAETVEDDLRNAGDDFIKKIKLTTSSMISEIDDRLSLKSQIRLPPNLQALFKTLDFSTVDGKSEISLDNRGDGIKTRHIPVILKFVSDQLNRNKTKGSPNINMIWGYEEPENNLEMFTSFKLAENFQEYSKGIQILITTHSPGFYSLFTKHVGKVYLYKVLKSPGIESSLQMMQETNEMDTEMGLMPVVAPYVAKKSEEIETLKADLQQYKKKLQQIHSDVLFVEGRDEVRIFQWLLDQKFPHLNLKVKDDGLGCSGVKNQVMAWAWISGATEFKALGIFDNDESGNRELLKLRSEDAYKNAESNKRVKGLKYKVPGHLIRIKQKVSIFPIELEEMYPPVVWNMAAKKGWLEERSIEELNSFVKLDRIDQTIDEKLGAFKFSEEELLYIKMKVPDGNKDKLSKFMITTQPDSLGFEPILKFVSDEVVPFFRNR